MTGVITKCILPAVLTFLSIIILFNIAEKYQFILQPEITIFFIPGFIFGISFTFANQWRENNFLKKLTINSFFAAIAIIIGLVFFATLTLVLSVSEVNNIFAFLFLLGFCSTFVLAFIFGLINKLNRWTIIIAVITGTGLVTSFGIMEGYIATIPEEFKMYSWLALTGSLLSFGYNQNKLR